MCSPIEVKCFKCGNWFKKTKKTIRCKKCKDWKCPYCNYCICNFKHKETKKAIMAMLATYERFLKNKK